jgi:SAM-dependent methyltransferase
VTASSYVPDELPGGLDRELDRLAIQLDLSWDEEVRILLRAGAASARKLLEVGCGPGFVTQRLLEVAPNATITAIDVRPELLARVPASERICLREQSLYDLDATGEFDFAVARLVLQHLDAPQVAVERMFDALAPGGVLVVIDVDAQMMMLSEPFARELVPIYARAERLQASRGGNRFVGRRLYRLLKDAGFDTVTHEAFIYHSDQRGLAAFEAQMSPDRLVAAARAGLITDAELRCVEEHHRRFFSSPDSFVLMAGFAATGRKSVNTTMRD